eukprot:364316-Chlamydomonas_euryale.AAC.2
MEDQVANQGDGESAPAARLVSGAMSAAEEGKLHSWQQQQQQQQEQRQQQNEHLQSHSKTESLPNSHGAGGETEAQCGQVRRYKCCCVRPSLVAATPKLTLSDQAAKGPRPPPPAACQLLPAHPGPSPAVHPMSAAAKAGLMAMWHVLWQ